ncbi:probable serine/threonine-protein kinase pats1 [Saccostrea echinata]|uniref:probable serine/threonine-protein kinase pats1 n=1 Tax=Saccostrea echinata TaxID=191078 RepID=UPI002A7F6299|nr:probable serine/threonine-protein kinase pats1 [Saccostrea echinata]
MVKMNIPEEILKWDLSARKRFVESLRHGRVEMFRARGMIVGCAGAGKTTLLRKLQRKYTEENKATETTVGLEVHEDLFEIKDDTLYDYSNDNEENTHIARFIRHNTEEEKMVIKGIHLHSSRGRKLISMTDFAGQVAYYACHQVYLSRRAFYIVVIDMSKGLDEEVRKYHTDRHNPDGSLFHSWKYKDYFHFWLQSIQTYCDDGKSDTNHENTKVKGSIHPVILVASHADKVKEEGLQKMFYEELESSLSDEQSLKHLISPKKYIEVECPPKALEPKQLEIIECLRKCIVETVEKLPQWGEEIPLKWANLEKVLLRKKQRKTRVTLKQELKEIKDADLPRDKDLEDGLQFLHEIGQIVYFSEKELEKVIIVDVQWFVDAFKFIITDENHLARIVSKNIWTNTGRITDFELTDIWEYTGDSSYIQHKDDILPYMDKLGLMTKIQDDLSCQTYYIPSMNRTELTDNCKDAINKGQKTSIMVFHFKTYLPHFFFFRLVVNCFRVWKALDMEFFCKNAAFYMVKDASHCIAIAVNKTSIQLQVFTADKDMDLQSECVIQIRDTVESLINEITQTFHRHIEYERGFSCTDINITDEDDEYFLRESQIVGVKTITGKEKRPCPKHVLRNPHDINKYKMMQFWF